MASQLKYIVALALVALVVVASAQDYDDEGGQGNDGYGGFSGGGSGDDDYAAPRERGIVGAEGSDMNPGYHPQGDESGNENYDSDDVAAAASHGRPTIVRPALSKLIKQSRK